MADTRSPIPYSPPGTNAPPSWTWTITRSGWVTDADVERWRKGDIR